MIQINLYVGRTFSHYNKNTKYKGLYSYLKQFEGDLFSKVFNYSVKHHCYRILASQLDFYFLRDLAKFLVDNDRCNFISIDSAFVCGVEKYTDVLLSDIDLDHCFSIMVYDEWIE